MLGIKQLGCGASRLWLAGRLQRHDTREDFMGDDNELRSFFTNFFIKCMNSASCKFEAKGKTLAAPTAASPATETTEFSRFGRVGNS